MGAFRAQGMEIHYESQRIATFPYPVGQIETFHDVAVVRLDLPSGASFNQNVYAVSSDGRVLWQIAVERHVYEDSPYTGLARDGDCAVVHNWDGTDLWLDPVSGEVVKRGYSK